MTAFPRIEITDVKPGSAGQEAGLRTGDVVLEVDGQPVLYTYDFKNLISGGENGAEKAIIKVSRGSGVHEIEVGLSSSLGVRVDMVDPSGQNGFTQLFYFLAGVSVFATVLIIGFMLIGGNAVFGIVGVAVGIVGVALFGAIGRGLHCLTAIARHVERLDRDRA